MPLAPAPSTPALDGSRWNTFPTAGTTLTARGLLTATEPLLRGVIDHTVLTGADREVLEEQIRATLALGTRETSLPLAVGPDSASTARELGARAGDVTLDATGQDDLVVLALLGRLYPENVSLRPAGRPAARTAPQGTGPSRLVTLVDPPRTH
ncbi:hypothetical protein ACFYXC_20780 [Streptomyces sp. NPDC002701]|uniref:hypothetical protein n=1 Tax=Streptomyces sp. NPDC002701 TaxID=3364661 RepID=UPI0036C77D5B